MSKIRWGDYSKHSTCVRIQPRPSRSCGLASTLLPTTSLLAPSSDEPSRDTQLDCSQPPCLVLRLTTPSRESGCSPGCETQRSSPLSSSLVARSAPSPICTFACSKWPATMYARTPILRSWAGTSVLSATCTRNRVY